jgi:hypothetical protein
LDFGNLRGTYFFSVPKRICFFVVSPEHPRVGPINYIHGLSTTNQDLYALFYHIDFFAADITEVDFINIRHLFNVLHTG